MRFQGTVYRDSGVWLAKVPVFDVMTPGRSRAKPLETIRDGFETMVGEEGFKVEVDPGKDGDFKVSSPGLWRMIALMLRRRHQQSGLSSRPAAERFRTRSPDAYARYERGGC